MLLTALNRHCSPTTAHKNHFHDAASHSRLSTSPFRFSSSSPPPSTWRHALSLQWSVAAATGMRYGKAHGRPRRMKSSSTMSGGMAPATGAPFDPKASCSAPASPAASAGSTSSAPTWRSMLFRPPILLAIRATFDGFWVFTFLLCASGCKFTQEEERIVIELQAQFGNKWARIASYLPGRTDNDVKNFWSSRQKRLARILHASAAASSSSSSKSLRTKKDAPVISRNVPSAEVRNLSEWTSCCVSMFFDPLLSPNTYASFHESWNEKSPSYWIADGKVKFFEGGTTFSKSSR